MFSDSMFTHAFGLIRFQRSISITVFIAPFLLLELVRLPSSSSPSLFRHHHHHHHIYYMFIYMHHISCIMYHISVFIGPTPSISQLLEYQLGAQGVLTGPRPEQLECFRHSSLHSSIDGMPVKRGNLSRSAHRSSEPKTS